MGVVTRFRAKRGRDDAPQDAPECTPRGSPRGWDGCRGGRLGGARAAVYAGFVLLGVEAPERGGTGATTADGRRRGRRTAERVP